MAELPLKTILEDLVHQDIIRATPVYQRTYLEPVYHFFVEDRITDEDIRETVEQRAGVELEQATHDTQDYINIILGNPPTTLTAHKAQICAQSKYIEGAINSRNTASPRVTICLPAENPISFEVILTWINRRDFINPNTNEPYFYSYIVQAFPLAERLLMPEVCTAILEYLYRTAPRNLRSCHGFIYSNTIRGSWFRKLLVNMLMKESRLGDFCDFPPDYGANSEPSQPRLLAGFEERAGGEAEIISSVKRVSGELGTEDPECTTIQSQQHGGSVVNSNSQLP
ncbi:hypothetical protein G7Y79_00023g053590 [Physcia stellaris]|nr:hypothetical protein G7Y79_00023g053590 [Physcia stellaris]